MTPRAYIRTRKATLPDAAAIHALILSYSREGTLLPRTLSEICENVRDFTVVERQPPQRAQHRRVLGAPDKGEIIGCGALHLYGLHLAEVRSIAVTKTKQRHGAGSKLIGALLEEANAHQVSQVCLFTRKPQFFGKLGFIEVPHASLPDKIFKDCRTCPLFNKCDETAMVYAGATTAVGMDDEMVERPVLRVL